MTVSGSISKTYEPNESKKMPTMKVYVSVPLPCWKEAESLYRFDPKDMRERIPFELVVKLDLNKVPSFRTKTEAKKAALRLGLQTWRYVRF